MIKKIKNVKLLLYICLAMFLLNSCTEEKEYLENNNPSRYKIKDYTFKEANRIAKFSKVSSRMGKNFSKLNTLRSTNAREGETDFAIDESIVREVSIDDYTSYTMRIIRDEQSTTYFENLVIETKDDSTFAYIIKYTPTDGMETLDEHMHDFEGTIDASKYIISSITGNGGSNNLGGSSDGSNATSNNTESYNENGGGGSALQTCVTVLYCNYVPAGSGLTNPHLAAYGSQCNPYPVEECVTWGSTTTLGTNPTGTGPSGGQMGSGTNTAPETSNPITIPITPLPVNHCDKLKKVLDITKGNARPNLLWLKNQCTSMMNQVEHGVVFEIDEQNQYINTNISSTAANEVNIPTGDDVYGAAHCHTMFGHPIFSFGDLEALVDIYNGSPYINDAVFIVICPVSLTPLVVNTYALRVTDIQLLEDGIKAEYLKPKYASFLTNERKRNEILFDEGIMYDNCNEQYEKTFLNKYANFGISLYKSDPDILNWSELKVTPSINVTTTEIVQQIPCN